MSEFEEIDDAYHMVTLHPRPTQDDIPDAFRLPPCDGNDVYELSADELQHLLSSGTMTSVSYVRHCLERIRRVSTAHK